MVLLVFSTIFTDLCLCQVFSELFRLLSVDISTDPLFLSPLG